MKRTLTALFFVFLLLPLTTGFKENPQEQTKSKDETVLFPPPPDRMPSYQWKWEADRKAHDQGKTMRATARGELAAQDADQISIEKVTSVISGWLRMPLDAKKAPYMAAYYRMAWSAIRTEIRSLKRVFMRPRPYAVEPDDPTCRPEMREELKPMQSYPSGHTATYWMLALCTEALLPDSNDDIMRKAWEMGESRWICGHHWASDVDAGRILASVVFARLSADREFQARLLQAQTEFAHLRRQTGEEAKDTAPKP